MHNVDVLCNVYVSFQTLFAIIFSWLLCLVLTLTDFFPDDVTSPSYFARTDSKHEVISKVAFFFVPYPCKSTMVTKNCN